MESRRVLAAAIDLAEIGGRVFDDFAGNGYDAGEEVAGATVQLYRDDGDAVFEPTTGDTLVSTEATDAAGRYEFQRLTAGSYFVRQVAQTVGGSTLREEVSALLTVDATTVQGQIITLIDNFDTTTQSVRDEVNDGVPVTSSVAAVEAIGGERDLFVNKTSVNGAVQLSVDDPLLPDLLTFDSIATGVGQRKISWDGVDGDAATIDDSGLANLDLTSGATAAGLRLQVGADLAGGTAIVRVYSDDATAGTSNRFSVASIPIPATGGAPSSAEFLEFTTFTVGGGGGADFTNIGAIELEVTGAANVNGSAELVGTIGSNTVNADFDNFESSDLSLNLSVDDATPNVSQNVSYTITVRNDGPDLATGIVVTEAIPAGVTIITPTTSSGTYTAANRQWSLPSLASGATATLTMVGRVDSIGAKTATAEITAAGQQDIDSTPNNNLASEDDQDSVTITPQSIDLSLTNQVSNTTPAVNEVITYTITVSNSGVDDATNVRVNAAIPAGLTLTGNTPSQGGFAGGFWTVGTIAAGGTATLSVNARVNQSGTLTYNAEVISADQFDTDSTPNNNLAAEDDQASVAIASPVADLSVTHQINDSNPNVGDTVNFTVQVTNAGPDTATNVQLAHQVPAGMTVVGNTPSQGTYVAGGTWNVGQLAIGASATLSVSATVDNSGVKSVPVAVTAANESDPDSNPGNNIEAEDDQATVQVTPQTVDLSLAMRADVNRPSQNEAVTLTIDLTNAGPSTATSVSVADVLPAGLTFVSSSSMAFSNATGIWNVGSLAAGATTTLAITGTFGSATDVTNTAQVSSVDQFDIDSTPSNSVVSEDDQASVTLSPATADIALTKTVDNSTPSVGDTVNFTVTARNIGPDGATGLQIRDLLPAGLTYVSHNAFLGTSYNQATGLWDVAQLASSATATLTIRATANTNGQISNTAELIASNQLDPDSTPNNGNANEDDQATVVLQAQQIDLSLTHAISNTAPNVGEEITFTVTVLNSGPDDATGVTVRESLPTGVSIVRTQPSQGSFNTTSGVWSTGNINAGAQATLAVTARVASIGNGTATAEITAADQFDSDSTPGNNSAGEDDQAVVVYQTPTSDLSLVVAVDDSTPNVGGTVRVTTRVTNNGPDNATGVTTSVPLPVGLQYVSDSLTGGSFNSGTGLWTIGDLASGATATLEVIATVMNSGNKTIVGQVQSSDQADPDSTPANSLPAEDDQASVMVSPPVADLSLTHAVSPSRPAIGELITYTTTVSNSGPAAASGVAATISVPAGFSVTGGTPAGQYNAGTGIWTIGGLAVGGNATLKITGTTNTAGSGTSTAEVSASDQFDFDSTPANGNAAEDDIDTTTYTTASADLSLTSVVDQSTPNLGGQIVYTVTLRNDGPDATTATVDAPLPAGMNFISANTLAGSYNSGTGIWNIGTIQSGSTATLRVTAAATTLGEKNFTAQVASSTQADPDSTPANSVASEDDHATTSLTPQQIDLVLTQGIDDGTPNVGDIVTLTIQVRNDGPSAATGVAVSDRLPTGMQFVSATPSQGAYNSSTGQWAIGTLAATADATLQIRTTIGNTLGETLTAEVSSADQPDADSTPNNNQANEDDQSTVAFTTQQADLSLTQSVDNATVNQNDVAIFRIRIENAGPNPATNVEVRNRLPNGLAFVSATPSVGTFNQATSLWSLPNIAAGGSAVLEVRSQLTQRGSQANVAEIVASDQFDGDSTTANGITTEDDYSVASVASAEADLSITTSVDNPTPIENEVVQITVALANAGPSAATGIEISSLLPVGMTFISSQPQVGTYNNGTGIWSIPALASGQATQLVLTARVDARGFKSMPVEVTAADQFDTDSTPGNNLAAEDDLSTLVIRAPRILTKRLFLSR